MLMDFSSFNFSAGALRLGHLLSVIGERLSFITLIFIIREMYTHEFGAMLILVLYTITFILISPFIGGIIDYYSKKQILILSDILRSVLVVLYIPIISLGENYRLLMVFSIFTVVSISVLARSTFWAYTPEVIEDNNINIFNAKISVNNNFGLAFGTALGGVLIGNMGFKYIFILDGLTYLLSAIFILFTQKKDSYLPCKEKKKKDSLNVQYIKRFILDNNLRNSLIVIGIVSFFIGLVNSYIVVKTESTLHLPKEYIGYSFAVYALGSWFAPVFLQKITEYLKLKKIFFVLLSSMIILTSFLLLVNSLYLYLLFTFSLGLITTICSAHYNAKAMISIDKKISGRFSSFLTILIRTMMFLGVVCIYFVPQKYLYIIPIMCLVTITVISYKRDFKC